MPWALTGGFKRALVRYSSAFAVQMRVVDITVNMYPGNEPLYSRALPALFTDAAAANTESSSNSMGGHIRIVECVYERHFVERAYLNGHH